jgi:4-amino-4-deoxy-L-arabinose transferase-like glycosyltransferase
VAARRRGLIARAALFLLIFVLLVLAHAPLLRLLYFWDEAGYYIPAAYDIFTTGSLIPHSTQTNGHPPLLLAYLALAWKLFGYAPIVTRVAMLLVAALALLGVFALAESVANRSVAVASVLCTALYPVFFAQSSLAHVDLAAAAFTIWGIFFYLRQRRWWCITAFVLAALAKETAIITPVALYVWEVVRGAKEGGQDRERVKAQGLTSPEKDLSSMRSASLRAGLRQQGNEISPQLTARVNSCADTSLLRRIFASAWLLAPALPLVAWFTYHYARTGYIFGNPEFFRYNVATTLQPRRILFALVRRVWQLVGHMNLYVLTLVMAVAMFLPPESDDGIERRRIPIPDQLVFAVVMAVHVVVFSLIGGAALARYLLPAIPLVIIIAVSTVRRRIRGWPVVIALVGATFVAGLVINPPYVFAPEDNLAYRDYVLLHQQAAQMVDVRFPESRILTAWPASDEVSRPSLGYVNAPHNVTKLENFTTEELEAASQNAEYDIALVFSTKYAPSHRLPAPEFWRRAQVRFFGDHPDTPPELAAHILGGHLLWKADRGGQWIAVIEIPKIRNAQLNAVYSVITQEAGYETCSASVCRGDDDNRLCPATGEYPGHETCTQGRLYPGGTPF